MISVYEPAYAKVNLTLDVLEKRPDGYHDLQSIFQAVSLKDDVTLELGTGESWALECSVDHIPCDSRNLAWKAAKVFCDATGFDPQGLRIRITKRIPSEAGLGGGSADAAAVLRGLNTQLGQPLSVGELASLGASVGSDVPFCVLGGTAFAEGRGERLRSLGVHGSLHYVLCKPELSFSTPKLFAKLDASHIPHRPDHGLMESALQENDPQKVGELLCNVFEFAVREDYPEIQRIKELLLQYGACGAQMTGSGSVVFGIFSGEEEAKRAMTHLKESYCNTFYCTTV